ncbi:MAG: ribose 5-phosphate isomerase B [Candidatus Kerfeldbacteria bacterium]|nr:ribose 5-phosphate isomerase B [Candidatus Kerfeldbacteria bacterium]
MLTPIAIAADHGGFELKQALIEALDARGYQTHDFGTKTNDPVDYPDYIRDVCRAVSKSWHGILICGTGIGMSIAANRFHGIRAALCHDTETARLSRQHNNANVLCLGGRVLTAEQAIEIVTVWLTTEFSGEERHQRRLDKIE